MRTMPTLRALRSVYQIARHPPPDAMRLLIKPLSHVYDIDTTSHLDSSWWTVADSAVACAVTLAPCFVLCFIESHRF
jgi:hypothetical protein